MERPAMDAAPDHRNIRDAAAPADAWNFRWKVILTLRLDSLSTYETHRTVNTPDELCELVLHSSMDPRIVAYSYHRYATLNTNTAPTSCRWCDEPFTEMAPRQEWRNCTCGVHVIYTCTACGSGEVFPRPSHACTESVADLKELDPTGEAPDF
ncbi:hypothetical protein ACWEOZ_22995 [Actinoplanes sp. NPDC004185]